MTNKSAMPKIDLNPHDWDEISRILRIHVPGHEVWAFGSRVKWTAKQFSDLDLAVISKQPLSLSLYADLKNAFDESSLPIKVDVVDWAAISESFHRIIEKDKIIVQTPQPGLENWIFKRLVDCTRDGNLSYGIVQPGQYDEIGIPVVRVNNINNGQLRLVDVLRVAPEIEAKYKRTRLEGGEVLLTLVGSTGQSVVVPNELTGWNIARAIAVIRPRPDIGADWINICLQTRAVQQFLDERANTTVQKTLNLGDVKEVPIPIPPREIKYAIESVAMALANKIELNRRMNATLEAMARALFQSWFVDFDPVRAKLDGRKPAGLDAATAALFPAHFQDSPLGHIPQGWEVQSLGEVVELAYGKPLKAEDRKGGPIRVYGSNGLVGWHNEKLVSGPGIVVGRKGNPGVVTWVHTDFFPIDTTFYVVPASQCRSLYFFYYALSIHNLAALSADSAVPGLNRNHAYMSKQVIPPPPLLAAFDAQIAPIFTAIHANEDQSCTIATIRDALLPKLLSGELSVVNVEEKVASV